MVWGSNTYCRRKNFFTLLSIKLLIIKSYLYHIGGTNTTYRISPVTSLLGNPLGVVGPSNMIDIDKKYQIGKSEQMSLNFAPTPLDFWYYALQKKEVYKKIWYFLDKNRCLNSQLKSGFFVNIKEMHVEDFLFPFVHINLSCRWHLLQHPLF